MEKLIKMTELIVKNEFTSSVAICRSCCLPMTEEKMKSLSAKLQIDATIFEIPQNTTVLDLFAYCTKLPIEIDDAMPQNVCIVCIKKLLATYEFLSECEATEAKLRAEVVVVDDKGKDSFVDEVNFDDIIVIDVKPKNEYQASESEMLEIADDVTNEGFEFLADPSSLVLLDEPDEEYLEPEYLIEDGPDTESYVCGICNLEMRQKDYADHYAQEHIEKTMTADSIPPAQKKIFSCTADGCAEEFYSAKSLRAHRDHEHGKSFLCPACGINCPTRRRLYEHEKTHSGLNEKNKRRADCEVCGQSITVKDMKSHLRRHTGERPYSCDTCGKTFRQCSTMRTHELMHLKHRPFPCSMCEKTFARAAILKIHFRTHTGEKPFACASCPNKYARRHLLANHERTHSGSRPYECEVCNKRFKNLAIMKEHRFLHSANQQKCDECSAVFTYPRQ
jgi:Zinc-finger associated domain (zf-AD)/Zinc-finger of C2H2 type/Zinc finger, C2H2 type